MKKNWHGTFSIQPKIYNKLLKKIKNKNKQLKVWKQIAFNKNVKNTNTLIWLVFLAVIN